MHLPLHFCTYIILRRPFHIKCFIFMSFPCLTGIFTSPHLCILECGDVLDFIRNLFPDISDINVILNIKKISIGYTKKFSKSYLRVYINTSLT